MDKTQEEKPDLKSKIIEELDKTGYPTEIVSASLLQRAGWGVLHNPSYLDKMEQTSREFDLRAYKSKSFPSGGGTTFSIGEYVIAECKKSEKPWVFFVTPEDLNSEGLDARINAVKWKASVRNQPWDPISGKLLSAERFSEIHHYFQLNELARTFYEPFKKFEKSENSQMIYSAVMSCVKATLFHYQDIEFDRWLLIYYPLIIFSGRLFKAEVAEGKQISLNEANHILLAFNYIDASQKSRFTWENQHRFIIDIVQEDYLPSYIQILDNELNNLALKCESAMVSYSVAT